MRRTLERKFEGMSPRERRREVLRMQRIERAARKLLAGVDVVQAGVCAALLKGSRREILISNRRISDLADALGMYAPSEAPKRRAD